MASDLLKQRWEEYQHHIKNPEIEDKVLQAMVQCIKFGFAEEDTEFAMRCQ